MALPIYTINQYAALRYIPEAKTYSIQDTIGNITGSGSGVAVNNAVNINVVSIVNAIDVNTVDAFNNSGTRSFFALTDTAEKLAILNTESIIISDVTATTPANVTEARILAGWKKSVYFDIRDTSENLATFSTTTNVSGNIISTTSANVAQAITLLSWLKPVLFNLVDTAERLAGFSTTKSIDGNISAITAATVAQAMTFLGWKKTVDFGITDTASNVASLNTTRAIIGDIIASTNATASQATIFSQWAKAVRYSISDTVQNIASATVPAAALNNSVAIQATGAATVAQYNLISAATNSGATTIDRIEDLFQNIQVSLQSIDDLKVRGTVTANGTAGNDLINLSPTGATGNFFLSPLIINGLDGDDTIDGNTAANGAGSTINGGSGRDFLSGGDNGDLIFGGENNDTIRGVNGFDTIYGGTGDDQLLGNVGNDVIYGDDGNDGINGGQDDDTLYGGAGNDRIFGGTTGNDVIQGGLGFDVIDLQEINPQSDNIQLLEGQLIASSRDFGARMDDGVDVITDFGWNAGGASDFITFTGNDLNAGTGIINLLAVNSGNIFSGSQARGSVVIQDLAQNASYNGSANGASGQVIRLTTGASTAAAALGNGSITINRNTGFGQGGSILLIWYDTDDLLVKFTAAHGGVGSNVLTATNIANGSAADLYALTGLSQADFNNYSSADFSGLIAFTDNINLQT